MKKSKIAISVDKSLLGLVDGKVDGKILRSRSQAIEYFLRKGLEEFAVDTAVILLKGNHLQFAIKKINGTSLIKNQLDFFYKNHINKVIIVTQHSKVSDLFLAELKGSNLKIEVIEKNVKGNAKAIESIKKKIKNDFIVMSGDTYNNFDLSKMVKKHLEMNKLATMGLMTKEKVYGYGTAILDGDMIIDFQEKPEKSATNIVNAGIYIFKPEIFELFDNVNILEKDLFPKIARMKQLVGFFTYGEYIHISG